MKLDNVGLPDQVEPVTKQRQRPFHPQRPAGRIQRLPIPRIIRMLVGESA